MKRRVSLESLMKWIFLLLALSMVALVLGTRLYQSYMYKQNSAVLSAERLQRLVKDYNLNYSPEILKKELGPYWRSCSETENPVLKIESRGRFFGFVPNPEAIYIDMVEEERYLILVGILGLIVAVELAILFSYILTRPLRRLTWMCKEIASGRPVHVPHTLLSPYEFSELIDSFNNMSSQLERWREVQRQLSRMDRLAALGEMISGLAHEIRNPLASMRIQADLLREEIERIDAGETGQQNLEEAKEQTEALGNEIDRLNNIVVQLLSFVKPRPVVIAPVRLDDLLPWGSSIIGPQAQKFNVNLVLISTEQNVIALADGELLRQIVMNLALNAIQAMALQEDSLERRLTISIGIGKDILGKEDRGVVAISDTGGGISPKIEHRIFDPFFTTKKDGTGLGLSIVQRITENMGAELSLDNGENGATFKVYLKLAERGNV